MKELKYKTKMRVKYSKAQKDIILYILYAPKLTSKLLVLIFFFFFCQVVVGPFFTHPYKLRRPDPKRGFTVVNKYLWN